ncbi:hypothetical protein FTUN_1790 [Frigoriglobus tundricola]|uniref:Uncharacterized protein n=1 Tax=Frigoriglobus tundricola TaxID=2774151 RepID=A0A6M5YLP5_9BACT|nr:hypothetical protein FTUN_1790 [Frigoriglobus tundricola]
MADNEMLQSFDRSEWLQRESYRHGGRGKASIRSAEPRMTGREGEADEEDRPTLQEG